MESRDGAGMLAAAAALLSARHARTPGGASSSVTGTSTSGALGGRVAAPAASAAWSAPPLDYANRHAFTNAVSQYTETTRSIPSYPHDSMMQLSYPVEYAHEGATTDQRASAAWGMSMDAPSLCKGDSQQQQLVRHQERQDQLSYQRLQEFQFQQQEEQQQQMEQQQQQLQQQLHRQQQQQQQLRLHQQKQHQHQQQLLHQQHNQRQPNSQHTVVQQHQDSQPSQLQQSQSQQPQPLLQQRQQWPPKNGKRPRQKQLKTNQKRKTQTHQRREIDAIVARAEQQPEFARPQYATQLQHASLTSQDDTLAGRGASAVIRPGQSIVPRPYQRRPVEANQRLKAMPGMTGFSSNNVPQDSRPLPAFRTMTGSGGNTTASVGMNQRFPRPAFPSSNDQSSRMWSYQHQVPSNGQPQSHQNLRIEGSNIPESIACTSQPPPTQKQQRAVTATGQGMLSGLDSFVRQRLQHHQQAEQSNDSSHKMNPQDRRRLPGNMLLQEPAVGPHSIQPSLVTQATAHDSSIRASPTGQLSRGSIGHLTSGKHYYMPPSHQQPRTERRFENAMWTDQQSHSAVTNQVDSDLAKNAKVSMPGFADTEGCATSAKHKALLPSLNFQFEKQSDWYFPSPTSNKSSASQKIKSSTHGTSTMKHQAIQNLKQLNQDTINSRGRGVVRTSWQSVGLTGTPHADVTIPQRSLEAGKTDELNAGVTHNLKVSPVNETKLVGGHLSTVAPGVKSKNRLRKIEKQNRRQQRQETIKSGVGKQQLDASNVTQQQSLHVEQARAQLLEKSHESRLNQLPKTTKQPPGPNLVRQQQMLKEHRREAVFATRLRTVNATSSSQPTATASHTDAGGDCVLSKTALLCEQEQLLRRAHLAMLAQQQLHQRNHIDFTPHTRPLPTVVARSSTVSAAIAVHKRSRGEFEQQNVGIQNSTSGVRQLSQRSVSKHKEIEADGKRRQPDGSASAMGLEKDTNISAVQVTVGVKPADQGVSRIPAPVGAVPVPVSATPPRCATPATTAIKTTNATRIEKAVKSRKRKASSVLAVPHSGAAQLSNPTVCKPRREKPSLGTLASSAVGVVADTVSLIAHPITLPPVTAVVPPESGYGLPGTESVMIFCKRDFFRFQAGLLWKKYQEIKRKRDQTLATVTGRRARYLNARYNSSNEGETEKSPVERARKRTHSRTSSASTSKDTGLDSEKSAPLQSRAVSDNLCEPPDLGGVPHDSHMPCQEPEPTCPHTDLAASPVHESLAEESEQRVQDGLVSETSCVVATEEDSTSQSLLPPAEAAGSTHTSTVEAQTDEPWKPTNGPVSEPTRTESSIVRANAFGDDNSEYVIIEEDTFAEWSCPSARDTSTASPTTPRTPPPSSECDTSGESQLSEAADVDPVVREQVQPLTMEADAPSKEVKRTIDAPASVDCPTAAVTTVTTFQIVPTPLNSDPVAPNETCGGSEIAPSEKTADSQKVPVAYREECLI